MTTQPHTLAHAGPYSGGWGHLGVTAAPMVLTGAGGPWAVRRGQSASSSMQAWQRRPPGRWAQGRVAHPVGSKSDGAGWRAGPALGASIQSGVRSPGRPLLRVLQQQRGPRLRPAGAQEPLLEQDHLLAPGHRGRHQGLLCPRWGAGEQPASGKAAGRQWVPG